MNMNMAIAGMAVFGLAAVACTKGAGGDGSDMRELAGLPGLKARIPADTVVSKNAVGLGVMLKGAGISMTIGPELDVDAPSLDQAKQNAQSYAPQNLEGETLADGYILTYENQGSVGTTYWLVGRRKFSDAAFTCGVSSPKKAHQLSAIAICKSLKK